MKIFYVFTEFAIAGGADRVVIEKANYLAEEGYDVTIVTDSQMGRRPFFPISPKVKHHDLGIDFNQEYQYNPLIRIFIYFKLMRQYKQLLGKYLCQEKPDIVITTLGRDMDFLPDINDGSIKVGEAHIARPYIRNFHLLEKQGFIHRFIARIWMRKLSRNVEKLDALVLLTHADAKNWEKTVSTHVIPNSLPFYPEGASTCENKRAIFVARMSEQKGYEYLINAWEIVHQKHPDWIIDIYGDGEQRQAIKRLIAQKGLSQCMIIHETTSDIQSRYLESSIYILSSRFEGFGMVLLEAMACGVPCVSFDCPFGPADIIKDGEDGFLVKYLDSKELARRVCDLIENPDLRKRMGQAAKENVKRYDKHLVMSQWTDLFGTLMEKRGKRIMYVYSELTIKGGTDRVLTDKANYLAEHGYEVTIVTEAQLGREPVFPLSPKVKLIDIGLDFNKQYSENFIHRIFTYYSFLHTYKKRLSRILSKERPDIVITTMGRSLDFVTKLHDGSVKIGEAHTTRYHLRSLHLMEERGGVYKWMARFMRRSQIANARKLKALVLLTPQDAEDWSEVTQTYVIPNSIREIPQKQAALDNKKAIIVGRYNDAKGYEYLVEAWDMVHRRHPDWIIDIYGSGELHDNVERWIKERHLESVMRMNEPTDHIMEKYLESSICVVSSRYEGFSMVIVEAMASGVPCVSFDCPFGPRNIIKDGEDGILVEYLNEEALADNICKLIEDQDLRRRLGHQARKNIQRYSQDEIMKQWEALFQSLTR